MICNYNFVYLYHISNNWALMWTITQLKSNVSHRFHLIDRIVLHEELCYTCLTLFIIRELRSRRRQGNTFTCVAYRFSNTNGVELIFRAAERTRRSPFRDRDTACIVFMAAKLERLPIVRNYSNYHRRIVAKRLRNGRKRNAETGWLREASFSPPQAYFRYKFSRKCNGSDLQSAANWPEAVMIRCQ